MIDYSGELRKQKEEIEKMIMKIKKEEKAYESLPEGSIRVSSTDGRIQYLFKKKDSIKEEYVAAKDVQNIGRIIQREYDRKAMKTLKNMNKHLNAFLEKYDSKALSKMHANLCEGRKRFINPLELCDEAFVEKWMEDHPGEQNTYPEQRKYETEQGELVRSKSEKIIADTLYKMKIPYRYEARLCLDNNKIIYPDFTCLNLRTRKTIYWEHLGLLGVNDYANKNFEKLEAYEQNGIFLGDELMISMEMPENPLNVKIIRKKIELLLK